MTDAFGGRGGIALYNRDLLTAICSYPQCAEVVAIPRLMPHAPEPLPDRLSWITDGLKGKVAYVLTVLRTAIKRRPFNLIICSHINLLSFAVVIKKFLGIPLILTIYGIDSWTPHKSKLVRRLISKVDSVIAISEFTKDRFLSWAPVARESVHLLPNAIDIARYGTAPKNPVLMDRYGLHDKRVIMTMGRISADERYKGFDEIIDLLPEIAADVPDLVYMIVGDGDDRPRLEKKVIERGLGNRVIFTGFIPEAEKADHYRVADAYVMPSSGEGFGFVFLEAMACGVPTVASATDGSKEAVRDGTLGLLVNPVDPASVKKGIMSALSNKSRAVPKGLEYFSFEKFTKRLQALLDNAVNTNGGLT